MKISPFLYLVAHAPKVPSWFKPNMPERPSRLSRQGLTKEFKKKLDEYYEGYHQLEELDEHTQEFIKADKENYAACVKWDQDKVSETDLQWPIYWAEIICQRLLKDGKIN